MNEILKNALSYADRSWRVVPADYGKKYPTLSQWQNKATTDTSKITSWFGGQPKNICIATGEASNLWVLDVDDVNGLTNLENRIGKLPSTYTVRTRTGGFHFYFNWYGIDFDLRNSAGKLEQGLDTRGNGGQVVAPPSLAFADDKGPEGSYTVLLDLPVTSAPQSLIDLLRGPQKGTQAFQDRSSAPEVLPSSISHYGKKALESAMQNIMTAPDGQQNDTINRETFAMNSLYKAGQLGDDEEYVLNQIRDAAHAGNHPSHRTETTIHSAWGKAEPRVLDISPSDFTVDETIDTYSLDDFGNADRVIAQHGDNLAYIVGEKSSWAIFNGQKWDTNTADATVKALVQKVLRNLEDTEAHGWVPEDRKAFTAFARKSRSASAVNAAYSSLAGESELHETFDAFNKNIPLINFQNGTLDTRTLTFREHRREDMITRILPVSLNREAVAPVWSKFLEQALPDPEIRRMLQVLFGYSLTGRSDSKLLPWLYGPKNSGKSVVLNVLLDLFGSDYGVTGNASLLYVKKASDGPTTSLDNLRGRRLVTLSETGTHELDANLLKSLVGHDMQSSRTVFKRESNWFPECSLWVAANNVPFIRESDDATWGRFLPVEFNNAVKLGSADYDADLPAKLKEELEGIMAWAYEGLKIYIAEGIVLPESAVNAQSRFREEADPTAQFINEMLEEGHYVRDASKELPRTPIFEEFNTWMVKQGGSPWKKPATFYERLESQGFKQRRDSKGRYIVGIGHRFAGNF